MEGPDPAISEIADALVREAGLGTVRGLERLAGGRNNRLFRVSTTSGTDAVLKAYFHHRDDPRDRLAAEYDFLAWANAIGAGCVSQPLARNARTHAALYSHVKGRPLRHGDITAESVRHAFDFLLRLNDRASWPADPVLPVASEAAFTAAEHCSTVDRRLSRLSTIAETSAIDRAVRTFVVSTVVPRWDLLKIEIAQALENIGIAVDTPVPAAHRVLSPSDFGFHNALKTASGDLYFLDFEYAGWDDPAKLLGDFFNQVHLPVPLQHFLPARDRLAARTADPALEARRMTILFPVYIIKWIAIILNEFLPAAAERRAYAGTGDMDKRKVEQLHLARIKFETLQSASTAIEI